MAALRRRAAVALLGLAALADSQRGPIKVFQDSYPPRRPGHDETEVFEDALPPALFERVRIFCDDYEALGRWRRSGEGTNFVPLDAKHHPRNPVEEAVHYLARHVVDADPSWDGVDWWLQFRPPNSPKEYHTDSDTFRLNRHNERWHPQVSSIFWFTSSGGASAVFNQSIKEFGGSPRVPSTAQLIFPRRNQYAVFMGDRYHGVLSPSADDHEGASAERRTLLINWWKLRPNEAQDLDPELGSLRPDYQPIMPWSQFPLKGVLGFAHPAPGVSVGIQASFDQHLKMWVGQSLMTMEQLLEQLAYGAEKLSERRWRQYSFYTLHYLKPSELATQMAESSVVPNFGAWRLEDGPDGKLMVGLG